MTTIGYIMVSSNKQTLEHQRFEIENFALKEGIKIDTWIEEKISSRKALDKRKLGELLNNLQENDILITCEISRLGRSLLEVMKILETCLNKNCQVWTLKENYRLGSACFCLWTCSFNASTSERWLKKKLILMTEFRAIS